MGAALWLLEKYSSWCLNTSPPHPPTPRTHHHHYHHPEGTLAPTLTLPSPMHPDSILKGEVYTGGGGPVASGEVQ